MDIPAMGADPASARVVELPDGWQRADDGAAARLVGVLAADRVPRHRDGRERPLLAAWVWPVQWLAVRIERRGWYLHRPTGTAFGLRRSKAQTGGGAVVLVMVAIFVLLRLAREVAGGQVLIPMYVAMLYLLSVGILLWLAHRQQRSVAERRGRIRHPPEVPEGAPALMVSGWHPSRPVGADPAAEQAVRALLPVIAVGRAVYARAVSRLEDTRLQAAGFVDVPGQFGLFVWREPS